jgi:hypothetical protein
VFTATLRPFFSYATRLSTALPNASIEGNYTYEVQWQMSAILEDIKPETAAKIAAQAKTRGLSVDEYLRSLLPDELDLADEKTFSPEEKARLWRELIANHSVKGVIADDSRESIYTREDEAL